MLVKNSNFLFFLVFCLFLTNLSQAIEPDVFVQSTVNRASQTLSKDITKEEKEFLIIKEKKLFLFYS